MLLERGLVDVDIDVFLYGKTYRKLDREKELKDWNQNSLK